MRLDKDAIKQLKEEAYKPVTITANVAGMDIDIQVETVMSPSLQLKMTQTVDAMTEENLEIYGEQVVGLFALVSSVTDIEWERVIEKDMETFILLVQTGIVNQILDAVPKTLIDDMTEYMHELKDNLNAVLEEQTEANEEALRKAKLAKE